MLQTVVLMSLHMQFTISNEQDNSKLVTLNALVSVVMCPWLVFAK